MIFSKQLLAELSDKFGLSITGISSASGGDSCQSYLLTDASGDMLFLKYHPTPPKDLFAVEAHGLAAIAKTQTCKSPQVIAFDSHHLPLEYIEAKTTGQIDWQHFWSTTCENALSATFTKKLSQSNFHKGA